MLFNVEIETRDMENKYRRTQWVEAQNKEEAKEMMDLYIRTLNADDQRIHDYEILHTKEEKIKELEEKIQKLKEENIEDYKVMDKETLKNDIEGYNETRESIGKEDQKIKAELGD